MSVGVPENFDFFFHAQIGEFVVATPTYLPLGF